MVSNENFDKNAFQFTSLILSLSTSCMIQLGKSPNPMTNNIEKDLKQAEITITLLEMLKEKTKGNLSKDEQNILDSSLTNLRLNYVNEVKADEKAKVDNEKEQEENNSQNT